MESHHTDRTTAKTITLHFLILPQSSEVSPPETITQKLLKPKRKSLLPACSCMGYLPKSCSPTPLSFMHKNYILVMTLQLAGSRTTEKKSKVNTFRDFSRTLHQVFDQVFVPVLAGIGACMLGFKVRMLPLTQHQFCYDLGACYISSISEVLMSCAFIFI